MTEIAKGKKSPKGNSSAEKSEARNPVAVAGSAKSAGTEKQAGSTIKPQKDPINPSYYQGDKVFEFIEDFGLGFNLGTVVKYVARAGKKSSRLTDLLKAKRYLEREILLVELNPETW